MSQILLVNPHTLGELKMARRKRKTARRRRHTAHRRRRANPHRRARRRHNPHFRVRRRRHRNPSMLSGLGGNLLGSATSIGKEGLVGALGALGLDLLWGYGASYLPASLSTPSTAGNVNYLQVAAKVAGAVAVGFIGGKVLKGKGRVLAVGAMTVALHDLLKMSLQGFAPSLPLGDYVGASRIVAYGAPAVGYPQIGTGVPFTTSGVPSAHGMGEYMNGYAGEVDGTEWAN